MDFRDPEKLHADFSDRIRRHMDSGDPEKLQADLIIKFNAFALMIESTAAFSDEIARKIRDRAQD